MEPAAVVSGRNLAILIVVAAVALPSFVMYGLFGGREGATERDRSGRQAPIYVQPPRSGPTTGSGEGADAAGPSGSEAPTPSGASTPGRVPRGSFTRSLTGKVVKRMGSVVVDSQGWTMYRFDEDTPDPSRSRCDDACRRSWLPVLTDGVPTVTGVDPARVGFLVRTDGGRQVTLTGWPLYRFIGDNGPERWRGQAVGNVWWVVQASGARNLSCLADGAVPPQA